MIPEITLPGGASTTPLGFGCSAVLGGRTRKEARILLDAAFDSGIRHFDVARVYGTGDTESVVGEFAASRRDSVTITSKFGIDPAAGRGASVGKGVMRVATRRSRRLLAFARRHGGRTVRRGVFMPEKARSSLEVSLGQLRTPYLDVFLLHDCTAADWAQPDLQEALEKLRAEDRIASFGPATTRAELELILGAPAPPPRVAQFGANLLAPDEAGETSMDGVTTITHGVYRTSIGKLEPLLADGDRLTQWSSALGLDLRSDDVLGDLLLAAAFHQNPGGIVLVSSGSPSRIHRHATCAESSPFDSGQLDLFLALAQEAAGEP